MRIYICKQSEACTLVTKIYKSIFIIDGKQLRIMKNAIENIIYN